MIHPDLCHVGHSVRMKSVTALAVQPAKHAEYPLNVCCMGHNVEQSLGNKLQLQLGGAPPPSFGVGFTVDWVVGL